MTCLLLLLQLRLVLLCGRSRAAKLCDHVVDNGQTPRYYIALRLYCLLQNCKVDQPLAVLFAELRSTTELPCPQSRNDLTHAMMCGQRREKLGLPLDATGEQCDAAEQVCFMAGSRCVSRSATIVCLFPRAVPLLLLSCALLLSYPAQHPGMI